jgi:hypothetical protein
MSGPVLSILVFLLVGGLASAWLLGIRLPRERREFGLRALSAMHWREFQRLVIQALRRRGFEQVPYGAGLDQEGVVGLRHQERDWLLSTKHGAGYVLGLPAVHEFASMMQLHGAAGGWMTTLGKLMPDTISQARLHRIELLDAPGVWAAIEPVLEPEQREEIVGDARRRVLRELALAWGLAAAAGGATFLLAGYGPAVSEAPATTTTPPAASTEGAQPAAAASRPQADAVPANGAAANSVPDDPAALEARRRTLARTIATLPWVDRALWSTQSTLVVHLAGETDADKDALCALVERYPELRASRLQLQPPRGSDRPVRFTQCRVY